jgi:hypothetical protein
MSMNVTYKVAGGKLVIEVNLSAKAIAEAVPSASGKTRLVASTRGTQTLPQIDGREVTFALNVMVKP